MARTPGVQQDLTSAAAAQDAFEPRLQREIERLLGGPLDAKRWKTVGKALAALHGRFVSEQLPEPSHEPYFTDRTAVAAYLAYFFLASRAQVSRALAEVEVPEGASPLRVLDIGSGPGPALVAVAEWARAQGRSVDATALEAAPSALDTLGRLWPTSWGKLETRPWKGGQALPEGTYDVIVAAHVLNELFSEEQTRLDRRTKLAQDLGKKLAPGGLLVLVEPALKRTGRELLVVRDRLLQSGMVALAPCLLQAACPAITRPRDWCHADRPWDAPQLVMQAGEAAGLARESLKFSYVVLSNRLPSPERAKDQSLFRIVSDPLPEKGKLRYFGCGGAGRHALVRLDRESTEENKAFSTLERGDLVRLEGLVASGDGKRVQPAGKVVVEIAARDRDGRKG